MTPGSRPPRGAKKSRRRFSAVFGLRGPAMGAGAVKKRLGTKSWSQGGSLGLRAPALRTVHGGGSLGATATTTTAPVRRSDALLGVPLHARGAQGLLPAIEVRRDVLEVVERDLSLPIRVDPSSIFALSVLGRCSPFLGPRGTPRRHGWIRLEILAQANPGIELGADFVNPDPNPIASSQATTESFWPLSASGGPRRAPGPSEKLLGTKSRSWGEG